MSDTLIIDVGLDGRRIATIRYAHAKDFLKAFAALQELMHVFSNIQVRRTINCLAPYKNEPPLWRHHRPIHRMVPTTEDLYTDPEALTCLSDPREKLLHAICDLGGGINEADLSAASTLWPDTIFPVCQDMSLGQVSITTASMEKDDEEGDGFADIDITRQVVANDCWSVTGLQEEGHSDTRHISWIPGLDSPQIPWCHLDALVCRLKRYDPAHLPLFACRNETTFMVPYMGTAYY